MFFCIAAMLGACSEQHEHAPDEATDRQVLDHDAAIAIAVHHAIMTRNQVLLNAIRRVGSTNIRLHRVNDESPDARWTAALAQVVRRIPDGFGQGNEQTYAVLITFEPRSGTSLMFRASFTNENSLEEKIEMNGFFGGVHGIIDHSEYCSPTTTITITDVSSLPSFSSARSTSMFTAVSGSKSSAASASPM